jgi:hypothetical protein
VRSVGAWMRVRKDTGVRVALRSDERCRATNGGTTRQVQSQTSLLRFPDLLNLQTYISSGFIF